MSRRQDRKNVFANVEGQQLQEVGVAKVTLCANRYTCGTWTGGNDISLAQSEMGAEFEK